MKSHDRVEVGADGLWRRGSEEPTDRSPYDQGIENAPSMRSWVMRRAYDPRCPIRDAVWFPYPGGELVAQLDARIDVTPGVILTRPYLQREHLVTKVVKAPRTGEEQLRRRGMRHEEGRPTEDDIPEAREPLTPPVSWQQVTADARGPRTSLRNLTEN